MAYQVYVNCDECGDADKVPQVGSVPVNWLQLRYIPKGANEPEAKVLCSLKCGIALLGKLVKERMNDRSE